jgi:hypothetical protein
MQNTIISTGIFLTTHSMLLYIIDSKKCFPTMLMGDNLWYLMENTIPCLCWEIPTIYRKILMPVVCQKSLDRAHPVLYSFLNAFPLGKTENVHLKCWGIPSFE